MRWKPLVVVCLISLPVLASAVTVNVSTPANNATVTSPVLVVASATSWKQITGWRIYVDSVSVYQAGATRSISASLSMAAGTHQVVVRAWNSNGSYGSVYLTETVQSSTSGSPQGAVTPTSLAFGSLNTNTTSSAQAVTITNSGTANLNISGVSISPSQFAVSGPSSTSVAPGSSVAYNVTFTPTATSTYSGQLSFTTNSATAVAPVALSGTGVDQSGTNASCSGTTYYVSTSGSDSNSGVSATSPWKTVAKVVAFEPSLRAGDCVLFQRGGVWNEMLTISGLTGTASAPITFSNYGTGNLPVIEGGGTRNFGIIDASSDSVNPTGQSASSYVTIDGFEIRNAVVGGIVFANLAQYGIVVKNNVIHNNGYGAYSGACAGCFGADDGHYGYNEAISMYYYPHDTSHNYKPQILNNTVYQEGGHNAIMVDGAAGNSDGPVVSGNVVGPGCSHNCYDYKRSQHVLFSHNTANCQGTVTVNGQSYAACNANAFYTEQDDSGYTDSATYQFNIANGAASGYMCYSVHCGSGPNNEVFYNNDCYAGSTGALAFGTGTSCSSSTSSLTLRNNLFDGGSCDSLSGYFTVNSDYNNRFNASGCPTGQHDIMTDPLFVSPGRDFHLQLTSPALSNGDSTLGVPQIGACGSSGTCP